MSIRSNQERGPSEKSALLAKSTMFADVCSVILNQPLYKANHGPAYEPMTDAD